MNYQFTSEMNGHKTIYYVTQGDFTHLSEGLQEALQQLTEKTVIDAKKAFVRAFQFDAQHLAVVVNMPEKTDSVFKKYDHIRMAIYQLMKHATAEKLSEIAIHVAEIGVCRGELATILGEMVQYSRYHFDRFQSDHKESALERVIVIDPREDKLEFLESKFKEGLELGECINHTRYLVDEPANLMYPETLAQYAKTMGETYGFDVEVKTLDEIRDLNMGAYLAVGESSNRAPHLIVMRYNGAPESSEVFGLVGKGLTYDTGGLSLKPTPHMYTMKSDMAGGATVMGTMAYLARHHVHANVVGVIAAAENIVTAASYKPGDIITTMAGKTIFIGNTDAEGRLTLVDAIHYAIEKEHATEIIDLATLTGAAIVAVGVMATAVISNNDQLKQEILDAATVSGEYMWELPNWEVYQQCIKHHEADYTNTASGFSGAPGTITAGQLLGEFVQDRPWVHLDIAGPAHLENAIGYYEKGASGHGVKTLVRLFENRGLLQPMRCHHD